mgnify:CR=1 FL=1
MIFLILDRFYSRIRNGLFFEWGLVFVAFCLPLYPKLLNFAIAGSTLFWLLKKDLGKRALSTLQNKFFIIPFLFYLLHILSFFLSENKAYAGSDLQTKLSFVLFPLLFLGCEGFSFVKNTWIEKSFLLGILVSILFCVYFALINSFNNPYTGGTFNISIWSDMLDRDWWWLIVSGNSYFNYSLFSHFLHPSYYALYLTFAAALIIYRDRITGYSIPNKLVRNILVLVLFIVVFLLQSRAGLVGIFVFAIWSLVIGSRRTKFTMLYASLIIVIGLVVLFTGRFERVTNNISSLSYSNLKKTEIRFSIWSEAVHLISAKPIFGHGTGDAKAELVNNFQKANLKDAVEKEFNAHSEYIEVLIQLGFIGLIVLVAVFIHPLLNSNVDKPLYILFMALVALHFIFESMLERMAGVSFIMYFWSYLNSLKLRHDTILTSSNRRQDHK